MSRCITGRTALAGVVGWPVDQSLSPVIFNAWIEAAGIDAIYLALPAGKDRLAALVSGLRGGVVRGLNVTAPFKEEALALADRARPAARRAGAANLLLFGTDCVIEADNTDGEGLIAALAEQARGFDPSAAPVVVLGAGGAARGAAAALLASGTPEVRFVNRTAARAQGLAERIGSRARWFRQDSIEEALRGAGALINATPQGAAAIGSFLEALPSTAVVMDMVYRPLTTPLLSAARDRGLAVVDGLAMLIAQARPSFAAMFGVPPPHADVRALAAAVLGKE
ncbi:MAG: shikimate dehydrogenase family protein [Caulobacteraceae bacterium]